MGYDIHIVRNEEWYEEAGGGISLDEWEAFIETDDTMRLDHFCEITLPNGDTIRDESEGIAVWIDYSAHDESGNMAWFDFRDNHIVVKNPDEEIFRKMHQIALQLNAKIIGDDGEEYDGNGEVLSLLEKTPRKPWWKFWLS